MITDEMFTRDALASRRPDVKDADRPSDEQRAYLAEDLATQLADGPLREADDLQTYFEDEWELNHCSECALYWGYNLDQERREFLIYSRCIHDVPRVLESKIRERYPSIFSVFVRERLDATKPPSLLAFEAQRALRRRNQLNPVLYQHGGEYVRVLAGEIQPLRPVDMSFELAQAAEWWTKDKWGEKDKRVDPPSSMVRTVLALGPDDRIPEVERVVSVPVLAPDGSVNVTPGYNAENKVYYQPPAELLDLGLPTAVTDEDLAAAVQLLRGELLGDFPFVGQADEANALAAMLVPFLRDCIDGATPFHMVDKPAPGTGAGLLADLISIPALGTEPPSKQWSGREEERRKSIGALLATGGAVVKYDNLTGTINAPSLNSAVTEAVFSDRVLGTNREGFYPVRCLWLGTANNVRLGKDFRTRVVPIRLDAKVEEPRRRAGPREGQTWRHANLRQWAKQQRAELVRACLIICQAWVQAAMPRIQPETALGSFEDYAAVLNGALSTAGVEGFLTNLDTLQDDESIEIVALLQAWNEVYGNGEITARDLVKEGRLHDELDAAGASTDDQRSLGTWLGNRRDRVYGGLVLRRRIHTGTNHWRVVPIG